jgi:hypothetical protein
MDATSGLNIDNETVQTSAGGPNWIEHITGCYFGLPSKCKHSLYNIAFAGADIDPSK